MFSKKQRFTFGRQLPKNIFQSKSFTLRYGENEVGLKVGVVVSKKVDKRAVARNKIKRLITEAVRVNIKIERPLNLVFYAKKEAVDNSNIGSEVEKVMSEISSLN